MSEERDKRKTKGFMALRNNVFELKLDLWHELKPLEYFLVDLIISKTIKWKETEAKILMEDLVEKSRQRKDYVYIALKRLETKGIIVRRKVRHDYFIGLNTKYFGELLIKKHADAVQERRKRIKVVVDNSEKQTKNQSSLDSGIVNSVPAESPPQTKIQSKMDSQPVEIIEETPPLNTLLKDTYIKKLLKDSKPGEISSLFEAKKRQLEDPVQERDRQLAEARKLGIL